MLDASNGRLKGIRIFRFGLIYKEGGGIETHLNTVEQLILERNKAVIIRAYEKGPKDCINPIIEKIGKGELIWIPFEPLVNRYLNPLPLFQLCLSLNKTKINNKLIKIMNYSLKKVRPYIPNWLYSNYRNLDLFVKQLYQQYNFDLAVIHTLSGTDEMQVINQLRELDVPICIINHFDPKKLKHPIVKLMTTKADAIGAVSINGAPRVYRNKLRLIVEGVDCDYFDPEKATANNFKKQNKIIFMPARIDPAKGHLDAVRALNLIKKREINAVLAFAGRIEASSTFKELTSLLNSLNLKDFVLILGELNKEKLREWYAKSDIVILPSYSEGLPRTILEAQLMERPVVAYDVGGVSEGIIDGVTGFLIEKGNVIELASRIARLLTDDDLRKEMGEKGRIFVSQKFSLEKMVRSHENLYLEALMKHKFKAKKNN